MHKKLALIGIFVSFAFIINLSFVFAQTVKFLSGDKIKVTVYSLSVRSSAGLAMPYLGAQSYGASGTVVGGPEYINGYNWWKIDYSSGIDGWSVENYLSKADSTQIIPGTLPTAGSIIQTPDTTPPIVSISTPPRSTPVTGSILIAAQTTDNVRVAGVQFYADGAKINIEDRYAPFNTYFNTIKFQNGNHDIVAVARDTSNNYATSSAFVITASNKKSLSPALTVAPSYSYNGTTTSQRIANITAKLYGTAVGPANYYFYCNSADLTANTSVAPDGKYLSVNSSAQIHKCSYPSSGTYYPKVIVERDGAVAQRRSVVSIRPPIPVIKFSVGDKIKVGGYISTKVNVRSESSLSGAILGTQIYNSPGTVLEGPIYSGGYWWWKIDFDNGADGWAAGNYFVKVVSQTTTPTQTTTPVTTTTATTTTQISSSTQVVAITNVTAITPFSATINWVTNLLMNGQAEFGTSPCPCPNSTPLVADLTNFHAVKLSGLMPDTIYYYRVKSEGSGASYVSENKIFSTTASLDTTDTDTDGDGFSDRIESFVGTDTKVACGASAWPADIDDSKNIDMFDVQNILNKLGSKTGDANYSARLDLSANGAITQADADIVYKFFGKSCTIAASTATSSNSASPVISDPHNVNIPNPYSATISWTTDKPASGQVEFGISPCPCSNVTPLISELTTTHTINLYNLSPETKYYYRIQSKDFAGNLSVSNLFMFTTHISISNISIISPSYGAYVSGLASITMSKSAYVKVAKVELYEGYDQNKIFTTITNIIDNGETFVTPFSTSVLENRWYDVRAKVYDTAGDFTIQALTILVDNIKPTASITSPISGSSAATSSNMIYVVASASDNAGLGKINFYKLSPGGGAASVISSSSLVGLASSSSEKWFVNLEKEGVYTLYVEVSDRAGNKTSSTPVTVIIVDTATDTDSDSFGLVDDQGRLHFRDEVETFIGTDPTKACGANAWPADMDNNNEVNILDTLNAISYATTTIAYSKRHDLNTDGVVTVTDVDIANRYFGKSCTP